LWVVEEWLQGEFGGSEQCGAGELFGWRATAAAWSRKERSARSRWSWVLWAASRSASRPPSTIRSGLSRLTRLASPVARWSTTVAVAALATGS
jgi:hypothetical protein